MDETLLMPQKQYVDVGDRIIIRSSRRAMAIFAGKPGTVVATFNAPRGSCMVQIDDTQDGQGHHFFYREEVFSNTR